VSFQGYLRNIEAKTGKSPDDFRKLAAKRGLAHDGRLAEGVRPGDIVRWLKSDFELGHGHAMAIVALLKGAKPEDGAG
jgi:hypothetical protein